MYAMSSIISMRWLQFYSTFRLYRLLDYQSLFEKKGNVMKNQRSLFLYINTLGFESYLDSYLFHFEE